ncbi:2-keto-gluconate dehydrogenase [Iodidimonas gelatinilytica]|uniref:2-keto-gluconate dehydrogenase n=1 Tax=Iodidimonas gelatinilytica TaxID=1236966 RepID=A0A5A7MX82_9PROT|nr:GMC family oxidoreductase [Iodidimonas gelatinilytica]GER00552.1 2-keto-gluconate dehydrogenase [Iodidimonas gelatinilytica]
MSAAQKHEAVDALIVGAGAAGSFYARLLAQAGKSVVVLDAGPGWEMADLISSQIWSRRLRWGGEPVASTGTHPFGYGFNAGWGLGGAALHHYGTWPRFDESDFKVKSLYGRAVDWPLDYAELRPFYDRIQEDVGLSGDAEAEIWRPEGDPYPMPPLARFGQADVLERGFKALGMHTAPMPMAINSTWYKGRAPCIYDGWCDAGCPIGALYNPLVRDIPEAKRAGADFRSQSDVIRVLAHKGRATGVVYADDSGHLHEQRADLVILAASAVHNPAILLNSASADWPLGLGNSNGLVGQGFMTHSLGGIYGLFDEETDPYLGVSGAQLSCRDGYEKDSREKGFGSYQWLIAPAMKPNDLAGIATSRADLFGQDLSHFMERASKHMANMLAMGEDLPRPENRTMLSDDRDRHNRRRVRIIHSFDGDALAVRDHARREGLAVMEAAGARDYWAGPLATAHMMGGTPMGDDPQRSVVDRYGRSHDVPNLVLAGTGLYPTAGAVNPTFTLYALSLRNGEHLLAHWSDYVAG